MEHVKLRIVRHFVLVCALHFVCLHVCFAVGRDAWDINVLCTNVRVVHDVATREKMHRGWSRELGILSSTIPEKPYSETDDNRSDRHPLKIISNCREEEKQKQFDCTKTDKWARHARDTEWTNCLCNLQMKNSGWFYENQPRYFLDILSVCQCGSTFQIQLDTAKQTYCFENSCVCSQHTWYSPHQQQQ